MLASNLPCIWVYPQTYNEVQTNLQLITLFPSVLALQAPATTPDLTCFQWVSIASKMGLWKARATNPIWPASFCFSTHYLNYLDQILGIQRNSSMPSSSTACGWYHNAQSPTRMTMKMEGYKWLGPFIFSAWMSSAQTTEMTAISLSWVGRHFLELPWPCWHTPAGPASDPSSGILCQRALPGSSQTPECLFPTSHSISSIYGALIHQSRWPGQSEHQHPNSKVFFPFPSSVSDTQPQCLAFSIPQETTANLPWWLMMAVSDSFQNVCTLSM